MFYIQAIAVIATVIIGGTSIWVNLKSIQTNKDIARENREILKENAGKNRVIYDIEEFSVDAGRKDDELRKKLNAGNYTILNVAINPSVWSNRIVTIGKIKQ